MEKAEFYKILHRRIAQTTISAQAMRKQGPPKMVEVCRHYLEMEISIEEFFECLPDEELYLKFLDRHTDRLRKSFPLGGRQNWGAARKAINLFLREIVYNNYFAILYKLPVSYHRNNLHIRNLEVPLDSHVAKGIIKDAKKTDLKWISIKSLDKNKSTTFQAQAQAIAKKENIARIYLDIKYWRSEQ